MVFPFQAETDPINYAFIGEAGCGKSELAIALALELIKRGDRPVHFFDLDMTKPLFRSRDRAEVMEKAGIIVHYEDQFMDAPTTGGGVVLKLKDPNCYTILDVGGDYIGARSIGGYAYLLNRPDTVVSYVINPYRPWSTTLEHIDKVLGETLGVSHLQLEKVHMIANPNLGPDTTPNDVISGWNTVSDLVSPYKPVEFLCVSSKLCPEVKKVLQVPMVSMELSLGYPWMDEE